MTSRILSESPLVGREHELQELNHRLDLVTQGKGTTVFVSGEAGSGKTRLVNEFLTLARKRGISELIGWCLCNSGVPYFPFTEAFNAYFGKSKNEESQKSELGLKAWLIGPEKSAGFEKPEALSPQAWKDSTFAAVTKTLFSIAVERPLVLFIDDLHWADSASLVLLQYLSRSILSQRILILATFRSEDLYPDNEGRPHPLMDALRLMGRENLYREIKLPNLARTDVSALAKNMVGGDIQTSLIEKLANESQGNPLFVIESLKMFSEKGSLIQNGSSWRLATGETGVPTKIKDIILRRVNTLKPAERKALDLASVIGSKFDPVLLSAVLGQDSLEVLETLSAIERSTSLVVCDGTNYRFDHTKVRDALYEEIASALKKAYHGRIADRMESTRKGDRLPVGDLAFHYVQAGCTEKAVKYSIAAGEHELSLFCGTEAIKHFRYVLEVTPEDALYSNERSVALEGLGDGLFASAKCTEAIKVFEQLSGNTKSNLIKMRTLRKGIRACMVQGDYLHALKLSEKAEEDASVDILESARLHLFKGMVKNWGGKYEEAIQYMEEALKVFEAEFSLPDMTDILAELSWTYRRGGQHENAIASALRACAFSDYAKNLNKQGYANITLSYILASFAQQTMATETLSKASRIDEKVSDPVSRALNQNLSYWLAGFLLEAKASDKIFSNLPLESMRDYGTGSKIKFLMSSLISGSFHEYKENLKAAILESLKGAESAEITDSFFAQSLSYSSLTRQYAELGDIEQAEYYYEKLVKIFDTTSLSGYLWAYALFSFTKAVLFSSKHQWSEANELYEEALRIYRNTGPPCAISAAAMRGYCWALLQQGRFDDAKAQFEEARGYIDSLNKRFKHAYVRGFLTAPGRVTISKEFNMRLDLVNVGNNLGVLIGIENLAPPDFRVVVKEPNFCMRDYSLELEKRAIAPFTDETITFLVEATKAGVYSIEPKLTFLDDLGDSKTVSIEPIRIVAESISNAAKEEA